MVDAAVSWADYMAAMQAVDRACVFGIRFKNGHMPAGAEGAGVQWQGDVNADTAAFARAHPEKLVGFMSVHPDEGDVVAEIERCATDLGLKGIKLGPNYQVFDPLGPAALRIYQLAERHGLPILLHQGASPVREAPLRFAHPLVMDEVAIRFPELRVVLCLRNPLEVALSLKHRDDFSYAQSLALWKAHNESVLGATSADKRLVTHYESYFDDGPGEGSWLCFFNSLALERYVNRRQLTSTGGAQ